MRILSAVLSLLITLPLAGSNPQRIESCAEMVYEHRNQVDYGPLQLGTVRGIAQDNQGEKIPKACVGVFTEADHKLVATRETDDKGRFALEKVPKGVYRLVIKYPGFCPANVRIQVSGKRGKSATVHMRAAGIDTCSYIEAK